MEGLDQSGPRYKTLGLRGNHLCPVRFNDVRVPPENVLGEPGDGFRIATAVLNNGRLGLGTGAVGLAKRLIDLTIEHVTTPPVRPADRRLRRRRGEGRLDGLLPLRPGVDVVPDDRPGRRGVEDYSRRVGAGEGRRHRVRLVRRQPRDAAQGRPGLHARRAVRADPARHPDLPDLRGRQRRAALVRRADVAQAAGRAARGPRRPGAVEPDRLARARSPSTRSTACAARCARTRSPTRTTELERPRRRRSPTRSSACATRARSCCASTARRSSTRASPTAGSPTRSPTSRPDRRPLPGDGDLRGAGRRRLRPGAVHRRDVLQARGAPRRRTSSTSSSATTTTGCTRSRGWPTSAARTATRCSRTSLDQ